MINTARRWGKLESGQAMVQFALLAMVIMGMLALAIDLGLVVFGQRRFNQNGADAAALALGKLLANSVQPGSGGGLYFGKPDEDVYATARLYAGLQAGTNPALRATQWASAVPASPAINQNPGLATRNRLAVTVEYWGTKTLGAQWCYARETVPRPPRMPAVPRCEMYTSGGIVYPPLPASDLPFKVRVTVSSTTDGFFARIIGIGDGTPAPPGLNDNGTPACLAPQTGVEAAGVWNWTTLTSAQAPGRTTCAQAVVVITGSASSAPPNNVIPITTNDCAIAGSPDPNALYPLWNPSPDARCNGEGGPSKSMGSFKNALDFTPESKWCNGTTISPPPPGLSDTNTTYDYSYVNAMPSGALVAGGPCDGRTPDTTWNRSTFVPDSNPLAPEALGYPGVPGERKPAPQTDLGYWIGLSFPGTIQPDSVYGVTADGNWLPTYSGQGGLTGSNVSDSLYCKLNDVGVVNGVPTGDPDKCANTTSPSGTFFFARSKLLKRSATNFRCRDEKGNPPPGPDLGCRDAGIVTWTQPQISKDAPGCNPAVGNWCNDYKGPERVRAARILTFRVYCAFDGNNNCTLPPPGSSASDVAGRFYSPFLGGGGSGLPPSLTGNFASLE